MNTLFAYKAHYQANRTENDFVKHAIADYRLTYTYTQSRGGFICRRHPIKSLVGKMDKKLFVGLGKRQLIIRPDRINEFEKYNETEPYPPRIWVLLIKTPEIIFSIPIWRGKRPYTQPLKSNEDVMSVVEWCFQNGGIDEALFIEWTESLHTHWRYYYA
ncbi:MAG: hypothetical protein K0R24_633 [Gammaproteobacteria bacterium]|jgi:hypothetical protein|nr:hypothetical protein [Gammaproteobacteria bacterium]